MKILLVHPEDSPRYGPWAHERWDQIVDLGNSSESTAAAWETLTGCPVVRLQSFRHQIEDPRLVGQMLRSGFGQLLDQHGIDWWELTSLFIHSELETAIGLQRLAANANLAGDLHATRFDWPVNGLSLLLGRQSRCFDGRPRIAKRLSRLISNYGKVTLAQAVDVFWDKYDAGYHFRSKLVPFPQASSKSVVLLPSAYTNVSRAASGYARLLPEQNFLLVATRESGLQFDCPANVRVERLASYAGNERQRSQVASILHGWEALRTQLQRIPEVALLSRAGLLQPYPRLLRNGLAACRAWQSVLDREPVTAVMCGDDSNWFTRMPVVLAGKRSLPAIDFHHGAFDGRFLLKTLSSDLYLAKNEMEKDYLTRICALPADRILVGAVQSVPADQQIAGGNRPNVVHFSEPYESIGGRPEEIYRELLPPLQRLAAKHGRTLIVKLHPFEGVQHRRRLIAEALGSELAKQVKVVDGALTPKLLASTWFGITVESSTVLDCARSGVPCFHCQWLVTTPWAYGEQYARFGVGRCLRSASEIDDIPRMLEAPSQQQSEGKPLRPAAEILREVFSSRTVRQ